MANTLVPYNKHLKSLARELRKKPTPAEKALWPHIRRKSLGVEFHRQVPLLLYIIDFYCHEIGLAIELDGSIHNQQFIEDASRQGELEQKGVHFLRFTNEQVLSEIDEVLIVITKVVEERFS